MLDAVGIDALLHELRPLLAGRRLERPRACGRDAVCFRLPRGAQLRLDAGRGRAGLYLFEADEIPSLPVPRSRSACPAQSRDGGDRARGGTAEFISAVPEDEPSPRTRHALLLLRKHAEGRRIVGLERVPGGRTVVVDLGSCVLTLRLSGHAPSLALAVDGAVVATLGEGPPAWPPEPLPQSEWDVVAVSAVSAAADDARSRGLDPWRGVLSACPGLGPLLARLTDGSPASFEALRARLRSPRPHLLAPALPGAWTDRALAEPSALTLAPIDPGPAPGRVVVEAPSWTSAVALFLSGRLRGDAFEAARQRATADASREVRRLERLLARLDGDRCGLPEPALLRRQAEALLAALPRVPERSGEVEVEDPYQPGRVLRLRLDPALGAAANADRLFEKARRVERASARLDERVLETRAALEKARRRQESVRGADKVGDIEPVPDPRPELRGDAWGEVRHYLTTRGLSLLAGRGARENHRLTFAVARPEDLWLHARDVPGAHVVLRDPEGRAADQDVREAAEVAAWFSASRADAAVDVHVARRKHLRPVRGSPGRVRIGHSETVRVSPRDPEGRLRRRASRGL